jgi:hypothetical protein
MTTISNLEAHGVPVTAHAGPLETTVTVYNTDQLFARCSTMAWTNRPGTRITRRCSMASPRPAPTR